MVQSPDAAGQVRNAQTVKDFQDIKGIKDFKEMPVKALRGLFSGIGQLLLAADRFRAEDTQRAGIDEDGQVDPPSGLDSERWLDATGKMRLLTPDMPAAPDLPVSGYDGLSLASLRARLRYLDAKQLRILLEHEKSASNRANVVTMFERRIAKIESGPDAT
jgi:hypothetical protein